MVLVFLLNYSWTYATAWSVTKCVHSRHVFCFLTWILDVSFLILQLPGSSFHQERSFFNTVLHPRYHLVSHPVLFLIQVAYPSFHLSDYGGALSPLHLIEDPLNPGPEYQNNCASYSSRDKCMSAPNETLHRQPSSVFIPPRSALNPFFGYPTLTSVSKPHMMQPGRRRKRDLLLTLLILWWKRWGARIITLLYFLIAVGLTRKAVRRIVIRWIPGSFVIQHYLSK